jgi:pyruvate carboxylase
VPKVTPSSKVVGDLALHLAAVKADPADFEANPQKYDIPDSVIGFMAGELGDIPGGWPEPFRTKVLEGKTINIEVTPLSDEERAGLNAGSASRRATLNRLLFPIPTRTFEQTQEKFGDLSVLDTVDYLYGLDQHGEHIVDLGAGVRLYVGLEAIGGVDPKGMRTVMTTLNGQLRPVFVRDRSVEVSTKSAEKAVLTEAGHVAAPFAGVVTIKVEAGQTVAAGDPVASIEAMKMEAAITATITGRVERVSFQKSQQVEAGDLLVVITPITPAN